MRPHSPQLFGSVMKPPWPPSETGTHGSSATPSQSLSVPSQISVPPALIRQLVSHPFSSRSSKSYQFGWQGPIWHSPSTQRAWAWM